eukprot:g10149.t1
MYPRQRQATLRVEGSKGTRNSSDLQRRASRSRYADPGSFSGSLSSPVAHLTKWPKNVFFASDFIAGMAAAPSSTNARRRRPRRGACSTNARKADARDPRTTTAGPESATGRRIKKDIAACRSSGCNARAVPQSIQGRPRIEFEESRPVVDVASAEEGGTSLEEAASALLLLHSRFVGGVRQEEGIVCRLCMLCKEAGWMGNPLRASPDLDPLVLEKMVVARLRSTGRQRNSASGHRKNNLSHSSASEEEELSFETFYRILADIATLVYPCEGKAMQRLLLEGVLPLAADKGPRTWSPSPELLYGRPALAALGMQRDALNELYCTYESRSTARAEKNSGDVITTGISRITFLNMLSDLGVTPASVSELHATSVFDNASRNGLAFSSRKPQGYRLCWSSFLEAMAALAVGAVKEWHTTANIEGHDREPVHKSGNSSKAGLDCNRDNSEVLHDNEDVPQREHCSEREKEGPDHVTTTDNVVVNFEAASATIFDELLEPMVIAVYSRHRKDLQKLFQRYSSFGEGPNGERLQYIGDSGIRRFVADFPVLGRWVESEGILLSIMRASRDRGWHHGVDEAEAEKTATAGQHPPPGLTYFGFLEVLSRTAYANKTGDGPDRSPLHLKLLALISAIKVDDTRGIWRL